MVLQNRGDRNGTLCEGKKRLLACQILNVAGLTE